MMTERNQVLTIWHYLVLAVFLYCAFYFGLAAYPLGNNNEGLYAEVAREMLVTGNYIIPHLNSVPYIEKPPLFYWLIALSYRIFGIGTLGARLLPATSAFIISVGICWFGQKINRAKEAWLAAILLCSSLGFVIVSRVVFFDMLLTACLTLTLLCFYLWYSLNKVRYLRSAYIILAFGVLTKGLVCLVLTGLITISFLIFTKEFNKLKRLFDLPGILLFLIVALPWHIAASLQQTGFAWDYFINEQVLRFLNRRLPHDYYTGPVYYYLPRILIYIFPWCVYTPLLTVKTITTDEKTTTRLTLFLWLWFLIPLLFFSFSEAKANYYMVVGVPPLVYLLSIKLRKLLAKPKTSIFIFAFSFFSAIAVAFFIACHWLKLTDALANQILILSQPWAIGFLLYCLLGLIVSVCALRMAKLRTSLIFWTAGITILLLIFARALLPHISDHLSEKPLADYLHTQAQPVHIYIYQDYAKVSSLPFYIRQRVYMIDSQSPDLLYGSHTLQATGWFLSMADFLQTARTQISYVAVENEDKDEFMQRTKPLHFHAVAATSNAVLLINKE